MLKYSIILFLLFSSILLQSEDLYFIQGHTLPDLMVQYEANLYKYNKVSRDLVLIRNLIGEQGQSEFIRPYYDERKVITLEYDLMGDMDIILDVIDMDNVNNNIEVTLSYDKEKYYIDGNLVEVPKKGRYQITRVLGLDAISKYIGINIETLEQEEFGPEAYKYSILGGVPGGVMGGADYLSLFSKPDGTLTIPLTAIKEERPVFQYKLPDNIRFEEDDIINAQVNNSKVLVLSSGESREKSLASIGSTSFYVLNKETGEWHIKVVDGGSTSVRGFGEWIGGMIEEELGSKTNKGMDNLAEKDYSSGTSVNERFKHFKVYSDGRLFIYNTYNEQYMEIECFSSDCEILLIEKDKLYYRIYNNIYQADIHESGIVNARGILSGDQVPDIHWAFIGK